MKIILGTLLFITISCEMRNPSDEAIQREEEYREDDIREDDNFKRTLPVDESDMDLDETSGINQNRRNQVD